MGGVCYRRKRPRTITKPFSRFPLAPSHSPSIQWAHRRSAFGTMAWKSGERVTHAYGDVIFPRMKRCASARKSLSLR